MKKSGHITCMELQKTNATNIGLAQPTRTDFRMPSFNSTFEGADAI